MDGLVTCFERVSPDLFHAVSPSLFSFVPLFLKFRNSVISMSTNVQVSKCPFNCYWMSVFLYCESSWWEILWKDDSKFLEIKTGTVQPTSTRTVSTELLFSISEGPIVKLWGYVWKLKTNCCWSWVDYSGSRSGPLGKILVLLRRILRSALSKLADHSGWAGGRKDILRGRRKYLTSIKTRNRNLLKTLNQLCSSHEVSSLNCGAGMPETSSVISLTGQNHINNWWNT
jgi:hypothetical protein